MSAPATQSRRVRPANLGISFKKSSRQQPITVEVLFVFDDDNSTLAVDLSEHDFARLMSNSVIEVQAEEVRA